VAEQARDHVEQLLGRQKDQAAERLGGFAGALREAASKLNEGDNSSFGRYADQAAQQVEKLSNYLRQGDLRAFVNDTEGFARRHPDLFLGSTFVAGLFLARFLKSSNPRRKALVPYEGAQGSAYARRPYTTERYPGAGSFSDTRPYNPSPAGV
jgi:hypothetical protein